MPNIPEKATWNRILLMVWDSISRKTPQLKSLKTKWCEVHINVLPLHRNTPNGENTPSILAVYKDLALPNQRAA